MSAKKFLGQHFLTSQKIVEDIVAAGSVTTGDNVLEIGPGKGVLTRELFKAGVDVVAVELDHELIENLEEQFSLEIESGQLRLIESDILSFDPGEYFSNSYSLIANIPYYITGKILRKFLGHENQPTRVVLLIQKEVAQRIVARDGKESRLSLAVKAYGEPRIVRKVPRGNFNPPPSVDSAVLAIEGVSREFFRDLDEELFFRVMRAGFAHKRKKLSNNLESLYIKEDVEEVLRQMDKSENMRSEDLTLDEWNLLIHRLEKRG